MTVEKAIEVRDRAIALGLRDCCEKCADAIDRLAKIGQHGKHTMVSRAYEPRAATVGSNAEDAARWLISQIGVPA